MRKKEKELRRTLDEMLAEHEEMKKLKEADDVKHDELAQFRNAIYQTNYVIELSPQGIITSVNQNLLTLWGVKEDVFVGKHYTAFVREKMFLTVWNDLLKGKLREDVRSVTIPDGKTITFRHKYMPICDKNRKLVKVKLLAFPV